MDEFNKRFVRAEERTVNPKIGQCLDWSSERKKEEIKKRDEETQGIQWEYLTYGPLESKREKGERTRAETIFDEEIIENLLKLTKNIKAQGERRGPGNTNQAK